MCRCGPGCTEVVLLDFLIQDTAWTRLTTLVSLNNQQFEYSLRIQMNGDEYISKLIIMRLFGIPLLKIIALAYLY